MLSSASVLFFWWVRFFVLTPACSYVFPLRLFHVGFCIYVLVNILCVIVLLVAISSARLRLARMPGLKRDLVIATDRNQGYRRDNRVVLGRNGFYSWKFSL